MSLRRIVSASVLLAVLGLFVSFTGPVQAQKEKKKDELDKDTLALLTLIEEAAKAFTRDVKSGSFPSAEESYAGGKPALRRVL